MAKYEEYTISELRELRNRTTGSKLSYDEEQRILDEIAEEISARRRFKNRN